MNKKQSILFVIIQYIACIIACACIWIYGLNHCTKVDWYDYQTAGECTYMPAGDYTLHVWYEGEENAYLSFAANYDGSGNSAYIKASAICLEYHQNYLTYDFRLTQEMGDFGIYLSDDESCSVQDIQIYRNANGEKRLVVWICLLNLLVDFLLFGRKWIVKHKKVFWTALGITALASLPLFGYGLASGHDDWFHFMRIESIASSLANGQFPVRISSNWLEGYGYAASIYYGDWLLYFPAALRLLGFAMTASYKAFVFAVNLLTTVFCYLGFMRLWKSDKIAILVTLVYVLSPYRLFDIYVRTAVGEYSALMFLPLAAVGIYGMYDERIAGEWKENALLLAVGMTGIITSHTLSAEMTFVVLVLTCLVMLPQTLHKNVIIPILVAVGETCLLSAWFVVPFIDYYLNVPVTVNGTVDNAVKKIQSSGADIYQYFAVGQTPFGVDSTSISERMALTPGIVLMIALVFAFILWGKKKASTAMKKLTLLATFLLWLSSNAFPWNWLAKKTHIGRFLAQVQFPWRYLGMATIVLAILTGVMCYGLDDADQEVNQVARTERCRKYAIAIIIGTTLLFCGQYANASASGYHYDQAELDGFCSVGNGEFLRYGNYPDSIKNLTNQIESDGMEECSMRRDGEVVTVDCKTGTDEGTVILPIMNYKGYQVTDSDGNQVAIVDGPNCEISFTVPANYDGAFIVKFVSPWYWRVAETISAVSIIGGIICIMRKRKHA